MGSVHMSSRSCWSHTSVASLMDPAPPPPSPSPSPSIEIVAYEEGRVISSVPAVGEKKRRRRSGSRVQAKTFPCPVEGCGRTFDRELHLITHSRTHSGKLQVGIGLLRDAGIHRHNRRETLRVHLCGLWSSVCTIRQPEGARADGR